MIRLPNNITSSNYFRTFQINLQVEFTLLPFLFFHFIISGQTSQEKFIDAINNNQSSISTKKILAKEINIDERKTFNFPGEIKKSNIALSSITKRYQKKRRDDAIANTMLRTSFDVVSGSLTFASYGSGPLAPIVAKGVHYVSSKTLDYVADMAQESMKQSSGKILKSGLKSYLNENGVENLKDKKPKEIVTALEENGYLPGIEVGDDLDENGKSIVMGAMINELAKTDEITLRNLAEQGQTIEELEQEITNVKAMGQSLWNAIELNDSRISRISNNMTKIRDNLQKQITQNKSDILANRKDIEYLQNFMYGRMSAKERIDALNSGFFPEMSTAEKEKIKEQLAMEEAREEIIKDMGEYLNSAGDILNIASNFGFKSKFLDDAGKLVQAGTHILNGVKAMNSPMGWLSATSSFSNLLSIGKPDVGATRHKQIMKALGAIMRNQKLMLNKLESIEKNQVEILKNQKIIFEAIVDLGKQVQENHNELLDKLDEIQEDVLINREGIAELVRIQYKNCFDPVTAIGTPFGNLSYTELKDFYAAWSQPTSNNIIPCIEGLNNTISFGSGAANTAFNILFDLYEEKENIDDFIRRYWNPQIEVLELIINKYDIDFEQFFLMSINPNLFVDNVDLIYSKEINYEIPGRLKTLQNIIKDQKINLIKSYYSSEATFEILNLFKNYQVFYETIASDPGKLKDLNDLTDYDSFNGPLAFRIENALLRLDVLILQRNLVSGSPLMPYYYKVLFEEEGEENLKSKILTLLRENPRLKANFVNYIVKRELDHTNSSLSQYHFATNLQSSDDPWLLDSIFEKLLDTTTFEKKTADYLKQNGFDKDSYWFIKIEDVEAQLPKAADVKLGHLYFTDEIFEAIELRNTFLDFYYGMSIQNDYLEFEKEVFFETLIYGDDN